MNFGRQLKQLRESRGISRETLAQKLGVSYWAISKYETGERSPDQVTITKIADIFGVSVDSLFGRNSPSNIDQDIDNIALQWPEGIKVLRRANDKLTPDMKRKMLRLIETYIQEDEEDED